MKAETNTPSFGGWMPPFGTPIYFEGEELPGGAPAPDAAPPVEPGSAPEPPDGAATIDTSDAPPPPPWEGKTPEELWNRNGELIKENTAYKERYRPWEQAAEGLDPQDAEFYREFLGAIKTQDAEKLSVMVPQMRQALDALSPAQQKALETAAEEVIEDFDPFDRSQVEKLAEQKALAIIEERERAREQEQAVQKALSDMNTEMGRLAKPESEGGVGIPEIGDPSTPEYATVLWMAKNDPDLASTGDPMERLGKAAQKYRDRLDERAQALLKAKTADAAPASPQAGHAPSGSRTPKDLDEARRSALERVTKFDLGTEQSVGT